MSRTTARLVTAGGLTGLMLAAGIAPAIASTPGSSTTGTSTTGTAAAKAAARAAVKAAKAGCVSGEVPTAIVGNPAIKAHATEGIYLGHDKSGYELKATHPGKTKVVFSGTLTASKGFSKLAKQKLEGKDFATLSANRKVLTFRFTNFGGVDGIHVGGDCSSVITASFKINGKEAPTSAVFLGSKHLNPTSVPFSIDRSKSAAGTPTTAPAAAAKA